MKFFVTGGAGFVGSHLVRRLVRGKHEVVCYVRETSDTRYLDSLSIQKVGFIPGDFGKYDIVYHLAGVLGRRGIPALAYRLAHVELTKRIINRLSPGHKMVFLSTGWTGGESGHSRHYVSTKMGGEEVVEKSGIQYSIIRPMFVYGPGDMHHYPLFRVMDRLGSLTPIIGTGQNKFAPMYVGDLIEVLVEAKPGVRSCCSEIVTAEEFLGAMAVALGKGIPHLRISRIPTRQLRELARWDFFTGEADAMCEVVENPTPLSVGLGRTVAWYKRHGLLTKSG